MWCVVCRGSVDFILFDLRFDLDSVTTYLIAASRPLFCWFADVLFEKKMCFDLSKQIPADDYTRLHSWQIILALARIWAADRLHETHVIKTAHLLRQHAHLLEAKMASSPMANKKISDALKSSPPKAPQSKLPAPIPRVLLRSGEFLLLRNQLVETVRIMLMPHGQRIECMRLSGLSHGVSISGGIVCTVLCCAGAIGLSLIFPSPCV
jgi:hypothetical protein